MMCPFKIGHIGFYYTVTDKVMPICPIFYGHISFNYISTSKYLDTDIVKNQYVQSLVDISVLSILVPLFCFNCIVTNIDKTGYMSIKKWTYLHDFIGITSWYRKAY
jgi:hypothetical protein